MSMRISNKPKTLILDRNYINRSQRRIGDALILSLRKSGYLTLFGGKYEAKEESFSKNASMELREETCDLLQFGEEIFDSAVKICTNDTITHFIGIKPDIKHSVCMKDFENNKKKTQGSGYSRGYRETDKLVRIYITDFQGIGFSHKSKKDNDILVPDTNGIYRKLSYNTAYVIYCGLSSAIREEVSSKEIVLERKLNAKGLVNLYGRLQTVEMCYPKKNEWICPTCSTVNKDLLCVMCSLRKTLKWSCRSCTLVNEGSLSKCRLCENRRK